MGNGMDKIIDGVYVGSIRDSRDKEQLTKYNITHILTIHEDPREGGGIEGVKYLLFKASDNSAQDIKKYFAEAIDFIHTARLSGGNVLVHCLAGISRSTSLVIAYIMTVVEMPWYEALNAVRGARRGANPNFGFQRQLQSYEYTTIKTVRENLFKKHGPYDKTQDLVHCRALLEVYKQNQEAAEEVKQKQQSINTSIKTYPLGYNAYNLDKNDTATAETTTSNNKANKDEINSPKTSQINSTTSNENKIDQVERDEFIRKLFD